MLIIQTGATGQRGFCMTTSFAISLIPNVFFNQSLEPHGSDQGQFTKMSDEGKEKFLFTKGAPFKFCTPGAVDAQSLSTFKTWRKRM